MEMGDPYLNFNLTMLNLWVGMCRGVAGIPNDLKRLGYADKWIEHRFANQDLKPVHPDLIISSDRINNTLLLEFKSGANIEEDQLRGYTRVTQNDLIEKAFLSRDATNSHDVTVIGLIEFGDRLRIGIDKVDHSFPLLLKDNDGLSLDYNKFSIPELNRIFSPRIKINWDRVPTRFVPLDYQSEPWEVAEVIMPKILEYMTERRPRVIISKICQDICITWDIMGKPGRDEFISNIRKVLQEASRSNFNAFLRWNGKLDSLEIVANPLDINAAKRTSAYRKLRTAQKDFIDRLKTGRDSTGQLKFDF